jgi:hypothetical protein
MKFTAVTGSTTGAGIGGTSGASGICQPVDAFSEWSMQIALGGTVTASTAAFALRGSNDGINFMSLASWSTGAPNASGDIVFAVDKPVAMVQPYCTAFAGGTLPTWTATVAAAQK